MSSMRMNCLRRFAQIRKASECIEQNLVEEESDHYSDSWWPHPVLYRCWLIESLSADMLNLQFFTVFHFVYLAYNSIRSSILKFLLYKIFEIEIFLNRSFDFKWRSVGSGICFTSIQVLAGVRFLDIKYGDGN